MVLLPETELKLQKFIRQYHNKSVWQVEEQLKKFLKELVRDELGKKITDISNIIYNLQKDTN